MEIGTGWSQNRRVYVYKNGAFEFGFYTIDAASSDKIRLVKCKHHSFSKSAPKGRLSAQFTSIEEMNAFASVLDQAGIDYTTINPGK